MSVRQNTEGKSPAKGSRKQFLRLPAPRVIKNAEGRRSGDHVALDSGSKTAVTPSTPVSSPRERLGRVACGQESIRLEDLQSLLAGHILRAETSARALGDHVAGLMEMLMASGTGGNLDPRSVIDLAAKIDRLYVTRGAELRQTVALLHHITQPARPTLRIVATDNEVLNIGVAQGSTDHLGGGRRG